VGIVNTFVGPVDSGQLGTTLIHEHLFVRNFELEANLPDGEWNPVSAVEAAVAELGVLHALGVGTVVDLTVPGLGRDVELVGQVAARAAVNLIAATGWYTPNVLPTFFRFHGPGLAIDREEPLIEMFLTDIRHGIAGSGVKAGMIKVMTDEEGFTPEVVRVMSAASVAQQETGVTITTHSHPATGNGLEQQTFLVERGVDPERIVIGHCGDSEDLDYLKALMDNGSTIGMDRFGMEHVLPDELRVRTVAKLVELGYSDRMVLSHDAAIYSHITPPSWRAEHAPHWRMDNIHRRVLPMLRGAGVAPAAIDQMMVENPRRLLEMSP
jgi:phosphotriesterase-related protein